MYLGQAQQYGICDEQTRKNNPARRRVTPLFRFTESRLLFFRCTESSHASCSFRNPRDVCPFSRRAIRRASAVRRLLTGCRMHEDMFVPPSDQPITHTIRSSTLGKCFCFDSLHTSILVRSARGRLATDAGNSRTLLCFIFAYLPGSLIRVPLCFGCRCAPPLPPPPLVTRQVKVAFYSLSSDNNRELSQAHL